MLSAVDMIAIIRDGALERVGDRDAILRDLNVQALPSPRPAQAGATG